ncbi:MAG: hypothetical protein FJW27_05495 [Acidimicrobiia bacterium]|nr:hypothetical protein [Acidimicrobiia bacterium]
MTLRHSVVLATTLLKLVDARPAAAQSVTHRGLVEARVTLFPQRAANDTQRAIADLLAREEVFIRATSWFRLSSGVEARGNSYNQVDRSWRTRFDDRTVRRPALAMRRLSAAISRGGLALDVGKQFIRWGKVDIVTPTDRFAPRDYMAVIDNDFLAVRGARLAYAKGGDTIELVVVPWFTPSRVPLLDQRWTVVPDGVSITDATPPESWPGSTQTGARYSHVGAGYEYAVAFFNGFNHLPNVQIGVPPGPSLPQPPAGITVLMSPVSRPLALVRTYSRMRMYGGDVALPTRWVTLKGEAAFFATSTPGTDEFVLFVAQAERQMGEWLLIGGYAGSVVTRAGGTATFAPDRGTTRSFIGRASYTIDSTRSAAVEGALRQTGDGVYLKGELSRSSGTHWRTTVAGALIRGEPDDFLGQFRRNSHLSLTFRYSF